MKRRHSPLLRLATLLPAIGLPIAALADPPTPRASQTLRDDVYLQETGRQIAAHAPLSSVAILGDRVFVGSNQGLFQLDANRLAPVSGLSTPVVRLVAL